MDWDSSRFAQVAKKQGRLLSALRTLFPKEDLHNNYMHPDLRFKGYIKKWTTYWLESEEPMELDVFIASHKLAFEFQGEQHYSDLSDQYRTKLDHEKREACRLNVKSC